MAELILALDVPSEAQALSLLDRIPAVHWVKVGSELFTASGAGLIRALRARGLAVFLDLKWHDIPNTVRGAVRAAAALDVQMASVHCLGGADMLEAAAGASGSVALLGVTVLTSHDADGYGAAVGRSRIALGDEVGRLAKLAMGAGLAGVVSSALEVGALRAMLGPKPMLVTPGIRRAAAARDDQRRAATPAAAVQAGATYLVVGRPVLEAADPTRAWDEFRVELGQ